MVAVLANMREDSLPDIENLYRRRLLTKSHVFNYSNFTNLTQSEVEDMFELDFYIDLVNTVYQLDLSKPVTRFRLGRKNQRTTVLMEKYFTSNPLINDVKFSRLKPAMHFVQNAVALKENISDDTFDRFEKIFTELSFLLKA